MTEPTSEEAQARAWWCDTLSLNEQKAYAKEVLGTLWEYAWESLRYIHEIWLKKAPR